MKRKLTLLLTLSALTLISAGSVVGFKIKGNKLALQTFGKDNDYVLSLDSTNKPTLNLGGAEVDLNGENLVYQNAEELAGGHIKLLENGYITKAHTLGLVSAKAVFAGDLKLLTGSEDGAYCYEYLISSGQQIPVVGNAFKLLATEDTEITSFELTYACSEKAEEPVDIAIGSSGVSLSQFNTSYTNQYSVLTIGANTKVLTITLKDDVALSSLAGTVDFSMYDKVVTQGTGKLSLTYSSAVNGVKANELYVGENTTLYLKGTTGGSGSAAGLVASKIDISGTVSINSFSRGLLVQNCINNECLVDIKSTGSLLGETMYDGFYTPSGNASKLTLTCEGICQFGKNANLGDNASKVGNGSTFTIKGNGTLYFYSKYDTMTDGDVKNGYSLYVQDSANVTLKNNYSGSTCLINVLNFVVANADNSRCDAKVNLVSLGDVVYPGGNWAAKKENKTLSNKDILVSFNSSEEITIQTTASSGKTAICMGAGKHTLEFKSNVHMKGTFKFAFYVTGGLDSFESLVYDNENPTISIDKYTNGIASAASGKSFKDASGNTVTKFRS